MEETQLDRIENKVDKLTDQLTDPQKGMFVRVDRLEQQAQSRKGFWNAVQTSVVAAITSALVTLGFKQVAP